MSAKQRVDKPHLGQHCEEKTTSHQMFWDSVTQETILEQTKANRKANISKLKCKCHETVNWSKDYWQTSDLML